MAYGIAFNNGCPCKGCIERYECCHSTCEKYLKWKKSEDERKEKLTQEKNLSTSLNDLHKHSRMTRSNINLRNKSKNKPPSSF